jgi:hypothetical protein
MIKGQTETGKVVCLFAAGATKDATDECDTADTSAPVKDGAFRVAFVPAGTYDLRIYTADGQTEDVDGLTVVSGAITDAGKN